MRLSCVLSLAMSGGAALWFGRHWPLVGDASLMHYVVFLWKGGLIPYKDIIDINLPGTYLFEGAAMRVFGAGAGGWRMYDLLLLALLLGGAVAAAGRSRWFAGVFTGGMFALVHLQDGLAQGGQRDLLMAALLMWGYAALAAAQREGARPEMAPVFGLVFGLMVGATLTVKPVLLPLGIGLLLLASVELRRRGGRAWLFAGAGMLGLALPGAAVLGWMKVEGALGAFRGIAGGLVPLHAALGRHTVAYLLSHSLSPIGAVCVLWLLLLALERPALTPERIQLLASVAGGALAYLAQGKGFPYQRYPLMAMLLLFVGIDLERALGGKGTVKLLAMLTCLFTCLVLAPRYAALTTTFSGETPFQDALSGTLGKLETPAALSGEVQCLDTFGGCIDTLYNLRVRQSTGFLYDCYLFTGPSEERERYRTAFWRAFQAARPRFVVETDEMCFSDAAGFEKIERWPLLAEELRTDYQVSTTWRSGVRQHWWNRREEPAEFRIFVRRE